MEKETGSVIHLISMDAARTVMSMGTSMIISNN